VWTNVIRQSTKILETDCPNVYCDCKLDDSKCKPLWGPGVCHHNQWPNGQGFTTAIDSCKNIRQIPNLKFFADFLPAMVPKVKSKDKFVASTAQQICKYQNASDQTYSFFCKPKTTGDGKNAVFVSQYPKFWNYVLRIYFIVFQHYKSESILNY